MPPSLGTLELSILLAVTRLGNDAYGLAVRRDVSDRTRHDYSVGAVYTTLERLEIKGFVSSRVAASLPRRGGRARRHFKVTAAGRRALSESQRHATSIWGGLTIFNPEPT